MNEHNISVYFSLSQQLTYLMLTVLYFTVTPFINVLMFMYITFTQVMNINVKVCTLVSCNYCKVII